MPHISKPDVCVVGGGLVGLLIGIMLARLGHRVRIMEGRRDPRKEQKHTQRSINLILSSKGLQALDKVGLKDEVLKNCVPAHGNMVHILNGPTQFARYGREGSHEANYSIDRNVLNNILLNLAERTENIELIFETQCINYDLKRNILSFLNRNTLKEFQVKDNLVIGADGYNSVVRNSMMKEIRMNYSRIYETEGYKELTIPAGSNREHQLEKMAIHFWPRGDFFAIGFPQLDGTFQFILFTRHEDGPNSFANLNSTEEITNFFTLYFPDVLAMTPDLVEQFQRNPVGEICTTKCSPWTYKDQTILFGDAAHGMTPFYGQGVNCGFQGCAQFANILDGLKDREITKSERGKLHEEFARERKIDSDACQNLAIEIVQFYKQIDDPIVQFQVQCEKNIAEQKIDFMTRRYQVQFSPETSYSLAEKRGKIIDEVLSKLCENLKDPSEFDVEKAYKMINEQYAKL